LSALGLGGGQRVEQNRIIPPESRTSSQASACAWEPCGRTPRVRWPATTPYGPDCPGFGEIRLAFQSLLEMRQRLVCLPGLKKRDAKVIIGFWVEGIVFQNFSELNHRFALLSLSEKSLAQVVANRGVARQGGQGCLELRNRLVQPALLAKKPGRDCCGPMRRQTGWPGFFWNCAIASSTSPRREKNDAKDCRKPSGIGISGDVCPPKGFGIAIHPGLTPGQQAKRPAARFHERRLSKMSSVFPNLSQGGRSCPCCQREGPMLAMY